MWQQILQNEFRGVDGLRALALVPRRAREQHLYAIPERAPPDARTEELAFEAFRDALDLIVLTEPQAPYLIWYGFDAPPAGAILLHLT